MEYIQEIVDGCHVVAIRMGANEEANLTINTSKSPVQIPWIGKKVGDVLTTPSGLSYKVVEIYIGENPQPVNKLRKCPKCNLNYLVHEDDKLCANCLNQTRNSPTKIHTSTKKKNYELKNKSFDYDLSGFGLYLFERGYSGFAESGANSTVIGYSDAIVKVCERENLSFDELCQYINRIAQEYSLDGIKRKFGENGKGTWRNALKRLEEFVEYQEKYLHRTK